MSETRKPAEVNALWRLLTPEPIRVIPVFELGELWRAHVRASLAELTRGGMVLVVERPFPRALRELFAGKRSRRAEQPSLRELRHVVEAEGRHIQAIFDLWPSAAAPNLAYERDAVAVRRWLQRSGVLVLGGRRAWLRIMTRSPLFGRFLKVLTPAVAIVVRPR